MLSLRLTTVRIQHQGVTYHHLCTHPLQTGRGFPLETFSLLQITPLQWGSPSPTHPQWEECLFTQTHMTLHPNLSQSQERSSHNVQASRSPICPVTLATTLSSPLLSFSKLQSWHGTQLVPWIMKMCLLLS